MRTATRRDDGFVGSIPTVRVHQTSGNGTLREDLDGLEDTARSANTLRTTDLPLLEVRRLVCAGVARPLGQSHGSEAHGLGPHARSRGRKTTKEELMLDSQTSSDQRLVWSVEEAGCLLGISRAHAYELVARGELPHLRLGRRLVVPKRALEAMLSEIKTAS